MSTIINADKISAELWKRLVHGTFFALLVICVVALRLAYLTERTDLNKDTYIEMAVWRVVLLLVFQTAPLQWARFIYKSYRNGAISIPLYQTMALLRMPLAIWTGGCLMSALVLWPILGGS